jgi:N-formylglutamate amidohydrolase
MRRLLLALVLLVVAAPVLADDCPQLEPLGQEVERVEQSGEARMQSLLDQLAQARGWTEAQAVAFVLEVNERGELPELQRQREATGMATAQIAFDKSSTCDQVETAMREMLAVIDRQWSLFNAELEAELARTP